MVVGFISTKQILLHPVTLIGCMGLARYLHLVAMCFDRAPHRFIDIIRFS